MKIIKYDIEKYNFSSMVQSLFDCDLSELDSQEEKTNLTLGTDTKTEFHKVFYKRIDAGWPEFMHTYLSFLKPSVIHLRTKYNGNGIREVIISSFVSPYPSIQPQEKKLNHIMLKTI